MAKKLEYYSGEGFGYTSEKGIFKVVFNEKSKLFTKLSEARKFYESLNEGKAIWDLKTHELLECHTLKEEV